MEHNKKAYMRSESFASDLCVTGTFIASQKEHRKWTKDGVDREMDILVVFVQAPQGVFVCRCYQPAYCFEDYKPGEPVTIPVNGYEIDGGLKTVTFRQS